MFKLPLRKLIFIVKLCFLFVLVLITLSLFEYWRGGKRATRALILDPEEAKYEKEILEDEARIVPGLGEGGRAAYLTGEEKRLGEEAEKKYAVNTYLSDRIAYNRTLRDFRNPACERLTYDAELPSVSVIIIFHNEPYSVVIRTIWSVLNSARRDRPWHRHANFRESGTGRTMTLGYRGQPPDSEYVYLKEIILVDDNSTLPELQGKLARYIRTRLPPDMVRVLRLPARLGLTFARHYGAKAAHGGVLVFLDSHCEGNNDWLRPLLHRIKHSPKLGLTPARHHGASAAVGDVIVVLDSHCEGDHDWLRPLLHRIKHSPNSVLTPMIDTIKTDTFAYRGGRGTTVGGFTFVGHFTWIDVPEREKKRRGSDIAPTWSPTMAGGLFAIRRAYYWELGAYDEQMAGWGGENLEMSFRIWQCGGTLETIPCSRVGHVFRSFHPYGLPATTDTHGINTARMAEVWMDEYKELFYLHRPDLRNNPKIGDVTHRKILREKLHCKSFQWFLDNVYQEKYVPVRDSNAYGRVKNPSSRLCLDTMQREGEGTPLGFYPCHHVLTATQYLSLSVSGQLRDEEMCAEVQYTGHDADSYDSDAFRVVVMTSCKDNTDRWKWEYLPTTWQLRHVRSGLCLDARGARAGDDARARACAAAAGQRWSFDYYAQSGEVQDGVERATLLPEDLESRLKKLGAKRRLSRSLLTRTEGAGSGEGGARRRGRGKRRRPKHKKKPKKIRKNKFIVTIERELANHSMDHLEMDIHCKHRRLYPNNSFVRDLVTILNDRNIRVINNGRVFERNRVTKLTRDEHLARHKEKLEQRQSEVNLKIRTTERSNIVPPASSFYGSKDDESFTLLAPQHFAEVTTPHAPNDGFFGYTSPKKRKQHRKNKRKPINKLNPINPRQFDKGVSETVQREMDKRLDERDERDKGIERDSRSREGRTNEIYDSMEDTPMVLHKINASRSASFPTLDRDTHQVPHEWERKVLKYPKASLRDGGADLQYEDHAREAAGGLPSYKTSVERPRSMEKFKATAQDLDREYEPYNVRRDDISRELREKIIKPDTHDRRKGDWPSKRSNIDEIKKSDANMQLDAVESFVFKDVWDSDKGTSKGSKVSELAKQVLMDYSGIPEEHPRHRTKASDEAKEADGGLQVRLKSNVTFNLGEELLDWKRANDDTLIISSDSEPEQSASESEQVVV